MAYLRPTIKKSDLDSNGPSATDQSEMYRISNSVIKRLRARYRDIASDDISRLIDALISDISMCDGIREKYESRIRELEERYETLKAVRTNSQLKAILFPQQKEISLESMLKQQIKDLKEKLKKSDDEIIRLRNLIAWPKGEK